MMIAGAKEFILLVDGNEQRKPKLIVLATLIGVAMAYLR